MSEVIAIGEPMVMFFADTKEHISLTRLIAGAGDGFVAGVISVALENLDDIKILERGNDIGGIQ